MTKNKTNVFSQLDVKNTILALVDFQTRMIPVIPTEVATQVVHNVSVLTQGIKIFNIPILLTEQYPKGLGPSIPELRQILGEQPAIEKVIFSSYRMDSFKEQLEYS